MINSEAKSLFLTNKSTMNSHISFPLKKGRERKGKQLATAKCVSWLIWNTYSTLVLFIFKST